MAAQEEANASESSDSSSEGDDIRVFVLPEKQLGLLERARRAQTLQQKNLIRAECREKLPPNTPPRTRKRIEEERKQALQLTFARGCSADEWKKKKDHDTKAKRRRGREVYHGPFHFANPHVGYPPP